MLISLCLQFTPSAALPASLDHKSIKTWWNAAGETDDAAIEETLWDTKEETCDAVPDIVQVTILETVGAHDEVDGALIHSIASQPNTNLTLYQSRPRFGSEKIVHAFDLNYTGPMHPDDFMGAEKHTTIPDILVLTTCEMALFQAPKRLQTLLEAGNTRLVCVVHHADQWNDTDKREAIRPWLDADLAEFWTLSPHTAKFLTRVVDNWTQKPASDPLIRVFVPLFPVHTPPLTITQDLSFAMQGDYDPHRRDYAHIFERLGDFLQQNPRNISMHLLGQGRRPSVPAAIASHVFFDQGLSYTDFYATLSRVSAVLPGFASKEYLDRKASSSVPAALLAGTPLVADEALLDAYAYVDRESVWVQGEGETEFDVVGRMLVASEDERRQKKIQARRNCESIIEGNVHKVGAWIAEAVEGLYCRNR